MTSSLQEYGVKGQLKSTMRRQTDLECGAFLEQLTWFLQHVRAMKKEGGEGGAGLRTHQKTMSTCYCVDVNWTLV